MLTVLWPYEWIIELCCLSALYDILSQQQQLGSCEKFGVGRNVPREKGSTADEIWRLKDETYRSSSHAMLSVTEKSAF